MKHDKRTLLRKSYRKLMHISMEDGPLEELADIVDKNVMGYGTAHNEKIHSFEGMRELVLKQRRETEGISTNISYTPVLESVIGDGNAAIVVEEILFEFTLPDDVVKLDLRFSTIWAWEDERWIFKHWHGSIPAESGDEEDTWHLREWKQKALELQTQVDKQTETLLIQNRELEIETALEKVRTRTMAMQQSNELAEVAVLLFEQIEHLGIETFASGFNIWDDTHENLISWMSNATSTIQPPFELPIHTYPQHKKIYGAWKKGEAFLVHDFKGKAMEKHYRFLRSFPPLDESFKDAEAAGIQIPERQVHNIATFAHGYLLFITREPRPEFQNIFERFGKVFEQTYTRFLDLKKAEAQAREAQIQLALERVRARAMAMHSSQELIEVAKELRSQLVELGQEGLETCAIHFYEESVDHIVSWAALQSPHSKSNLVLTQAQFPKKGYEVIEELVASYYSSEKDYVIVNEAEKLQEFLQMLKTYAPDIHNVVAKTIGGLKKDDQRSYWSLADFKGGSLVMTTSEKPQELTRSILRRFSNVFEHAYTRFIDLKKAEAQAREAQIQLALERVRARTMAMHGSAELGEVATVLFAELNKLVSNLWTCGFVLCEKDRAEDEWWLTTEGGFIPSFYLPNVGDVTHQNMYQAWLNGETYHTEQIEGKALQEHYDWLMNIPVAKKIFDDMEAAGFEKPEWQKLHCAYFSKGYLCIITREPCAKEEIFIRFAAAFDLTYTRFLDLQKAEAQAREAQVEASLERVRSQSMAMRKSEELADLSLELVQQVQKLGIDTWFCAFNIYEDETGSMEWGSNGQDVFPKYRTPREGIFLRYHEAGQRGETLFVYEIAEEECPAHYEYLCSLPGVGEQLLKMKENGLSFPTSQIDHVAFNKYGYLLFITFEPVPESHEIFKRFSKVFEQTYTRFLDLQKAEMQSREAQIEAALERTRAQSMMMQHSQELNATSKVFHEQLLLLGLPSEFSYVWLPDEANGTHMFWATWSENMPGDKTDYSATANSHNKAITYPLDKTEPYTAACFEMWASDEDVFVMRIQPEEVKEFFSTWSELVGQANHLKAKNFPEGLYYAEAYMKYGCFGINIRRPLDETEREVLRRFANEFERTYTRFLDLKKAEDQAREAQIEAALEKVRSRTMSMHKAEELEEVVVLVVEKLTELGVVLDANGVVLCTYFPDSKDVLHWISSPDFTFSGRFLLPYFEHPIFRAAWDSRLSGDEYFSKSFSVEEKNTFWAYAFENSDYRYMPEEFKEWVFQNDKHSLSFAWTENAAILIPSHTGVVPEGEDIDILKRFARVFEQAYVRFMDLKKAEARARETQIELSLERIRAMVAAMKKSEELLDIVVRMRSEFVSLGHEAHYFWHMKWDPDKYLKAMTSGDGARIGMVMELPRKIHGEIPNLAAWEKSDDPTVVHVMDVEATLDYIHKMVEWGDFKRVDPNMPTEDDIRHIGGLTYVMARTLHGEIGYSLPGMVPDPPEEDLKTLKRFADTFDLAYRRFEDLQRAEVQAREAQIELSLERIRAQVTAMQESTDLFDIVVSMRKEFLTLGHEADSFWHMRWLPDQYEMSMTSEDGSRIGMIITVPKFVHDAIPSLAAWEKGKEPAFVLALDANEAWNYIDKMITYGRYEQADPKAITQEDIKHMDGLTFVIARTSNGEIGFSLPGKVTDPPEDSIETLIRFAAVFDFAYKRFEDLKSTERQHREAQIELSLEKVRNRTMAMQHSDELPEAANLLFLEVQKLGIPAWSAGYNILSEDKKSCACIVSSEGQLQKPFKLPLTEHESFIPWYQAIVVRKEAFFVYGQEDDDLVAHYDYMKSLPELKGTFEQLEKAGLDLPTRQFNHLVRFSHGFLLFITYEEVPTAHDIFKRFGNVFEQTYTRFLDLQTKEEQSVKLEQEKQRLEKTLSDLRTTQNQLIQAEKMASLGELTAGIAHEIKNPLNFVNNFSEVSTELLDEMVEEIQKGDQEEAMAIVDDLKQNLLKIMEHGKRADGIVKGMLMHSRGSSGERELTDINVLCDEYLRLAYHGLRAKDKSFNADMKMHFDKNIPKIEIAQQDIGRVLLNLITNAFHAVDEKRKKNGSEEFKPLVSVSTKLENGAMEIAVADNGTGIPDAIKDKIFQPFFTTKPTGSGTGLGLSISYDIVKAHGGDMKLETKEKQGTTFIVTLPLKEPS